MVRGVLPRPPKFPQLSSPATSCQPVNDDAQVTLRIGRDQGTFGPPRGTPGQFYDTTDFFRVYSSAPQFAEKRMLVAVVLRAVTDFSAAETYPIMRGRRASGSS
jgi:hypothetical protein